MWPHPAEVGLAVGELNAEPPRKCSAPEQIRQQTAECDSNSAQPSADCRHEVVDHGRSINRDVAGEDDDLRGFEAAVLRNRSSHVDDCTLAHVADRAHYKFGGGSQ